jgi:hypothetical protein
MSNGARSLDASRYMHPIPKPVADYNDAWEALGAARTRLQYCGYEEYDRADEERPRARRDVQLAQQAFDSASEAMHAYIRAMGVRL